MGAVGQMLGTSGGAGGTGFDKPKAATIQAPLTNEQLTNAQNSSLGSLASQNALLQALQGQNGLGMQTTAQNQNATLAGQLAGNNGAANQASVFSQGQSMADQMAQNNGLGNQANAMNQQMGLNAQLNQANGLGTQQGAVQGLQGVAGQQMGLAGQYADMAAGRGPNPAQNLLNQQTANNIANQSALMAGQRGAGANVGLMARNIAQQGANTQQQSVGQAATMQANQQIAGLQGQGAALAGAGTTQGQIAGIGGQQLNAQQAGISAQQQAASNQVAQQMAQQQALAGQAQNQVGNQLAANQAQTNQANVIAGNQIAQTNAGVAANQAQQGLLQQGIGGQNTANVNMQGNINTANANLAAARMPQQQSAIGGLANALGPVLKEKFSNKEQEDTEQKHADTEQRTGGENWGGGGDTTGIGGGGGDISDGGGDGGTAVAGIRSPIFQGRRFAAGGQVNEPMQAPVMAQPPAVQQPPPGAQSSLGQFLTYFNAAIPQNTDKYTVDEIKPPKNKPEQNKPAQKSDPSSGLLSALGGAGAGMSGGSGGIPNPYGKNTGTGIGDLTGGQNTGGAGDQRGGYEQSWYDAWEPILDAGTRNDVPFKVRFGGGFGGSDTAAMARQPMMGGGTAQKDFRSGGHVAATSPQEKAVKPGNSYANDKVKALLSEGEIVLPRTVTQSKDPVGAAADFVAKIMAKRKARA